MNTTELKLDRLFFALSDPARREILRQLAAGPRRVGALELPKRLSPPAVAKHLRVLESAGLLSQQAKGRTRICSLVNQPIGMAKDWIDAFGFEKAEENNRVEARVEPEPPAREPRSRNRAVLERVFGLA